MPGKEKLEKKLTAALIRSKLHPGKYFDGNGLFLIVSGTGAKRLGQRISIKGKRTELGLGSSDLVSLVEARDKAVENRKLARSGGDPLNEKRKKEAMLSFLEATDKVILFIRQLGETKKHAKQFREYPSNLRFSSYWP